MTDTSALRAFIEARLDEDERAHRPVVDGTQSTWAWFQGSESRSERALREVAAKRAILAAAVDVTEMSHDTAEGLLLELASVWSDHPDYRPEWAPETVIPGS